MGNLSNFRIILLAIFGLLGLLGVLAFSGALPVPEGGGERALSGDVEIWGVMPEREMNRFLQDGVFGDNQDLSVTYVEKNQSTFDSELLEALASERGPDLLFLPQDLIVRHGDKVFPIPYEAMSQRAFRDTFVQEGELYLSQEGILALPVFVDPLIMYWNQDLYASAGIATHPKQWSTFYDVVPQLTARDPATNEIRRSAASLGEYGNIANAKELLSAMIMQAGNAIVTRTQRDDGTTELRATLAADPGADRDPTSASLRFYTQFSDPSKETYTWNRSLPRAQDMFVAGDLATYFGFGSELPDIRRRNQHLNMSTAVLPQATTGQGTRATLGNMQGVAILRGADDPQLALQAALSIARSDAVREAAQTLSVAPARRDLISNTPSNADRSVIYESALLARGWLDPDPGRTEAYFQQMIRDVTAGRRKLADAVAAAQKQIKGLIDTYNAQHMSQ